MLRPIVFLMMCGVLFCGAEPAGAKARRPVKPKLYLTVEKVTAAPGQQLGAMVPAIQAALLRALGAHPLVIVDLGVAEPTPRKIARALRRKRLRWYALELRIEAMSHGVDTSGKVKTLRASARVTLKGTRRDRRRKGTFEVQGEGQRAVRVSVVLQAEVLASRLDAGRAAASKAVNDAVTQLTTKKRRRRRRR